MAVLVAGINSSIIFYEMPILYYCKSSSCSCIYQTIKKTHFGYILS